jgi:hypothetical protein
MSSMQPELCASPFAPAHRIDPRRYARCVEVSKRVRWDIDRDILSGLEHPRPSNLLSTPISEPPTTRIVTALGAMLT